MTEVRCSHGVVIGNEWCAICDRVPLTDHHEGDRRSIQAAYDALCENNHQRALEILDDALKERGEHYR